MKQLPPGYRWAETWEMIGHGFRFYSDIFKNWEPSELIGAAVGIPFTYIVPLNPRELREQTT